MSVFVWTVRDILALGSLVVFAAIIVIVWVSGRLRDRRRRR